MEAAVFETLAGRGYSVTVITAMDPIQNLVALITREAPDLIFNFARRHRDSRKAAQIAALLDLLRVPYTGAGLQGILRSGDKALSRHLVRLVGARVPRSILVAYGDRLHDHQLLFPMIVKPRFEGWAGGTTVRSVASDEAALRAQISRIHRRYRQDAVCEEFIMGQSVSIGLIGNGDLRTFLFRKRLVASAANRGRPFGALHARQEEGRSDQTAACWKRLDISARRSRRLQEEVKRIYLELQLRDYARMDYRLAPSGELYFLQADHCPDCAPSSFGDFTARRSTDFARMLELVLAGCLERYRRSPGGLSRRAAARLRRLRTELGDGQAQVQ